MSWDQQAYSFGNPNAQPPTPTKTPTSAHFPSPTFQTPRNNNSSFEDRAGWTPTFAEEYSVFNSTPGRLITGGHPFVDVPSPHPSSASAPDRRLSITGDITAELATHVHHLSPNTSLFLQPVDPADQLPSSPGLPQPRIDDSRKKVTPRKPRKRLEEAFSRQTATPPATTSKGSRKLAPKLSANTMQSDPQSSQYGASQTPTQHHDLMGFPSTSAEFFNYPMSAPATAPLFSTTKSFWDPDTSMSDLEFDFSTSDAAVFTQSSHKSSNSLDWGRGNQAFQETTDSVPNPHQSEHNHPPKRPRPIAPKFSMENPLSLPNFDLQHTHGSDGPFSGTALSGAVDPGLLFSRNSSKTMFSDPESLANSPGRPATSYRELQPYSQQIRESKRDQEELRRTRSGRESSKGRRSERGTVSSPIRSSYRSGTQRSGGDNRSKITQDRVVPRTGRLSPLKVQSGLTSIPELHTPKTRTEVKFVIDDKGRARTETVIVQNEPKTAKGGEHGAGEDREYSTFESSSDEEPILITSRNTSFALPTARAPKLGRFETSWNSETRRHSVSTSSYSQSASSQSSQRSFRRDSLDSEAETVMEDDGSGDATQELRKVMETRKRSQQKAQHTGFHRRYSSGAIPRGGQYVNYGSSSNISPSTITDLNGITPSSTRSGTTRCVCNNPDSEGMMIQCESCDNWLHTECVGVDHRSLPPVYICAFCANTPNMRGGRIRGEPSRGNAHTGSSPLAHKSYRSHR